MSLPASAAPAANGVGAQDDGAGADAVPRPLLHPVPLHDASGTKTHHPAGNQSHTSFSALYSQCYTLRSVYGRTPTWLQNSSLTHKRCHVYSYILMSRNSIAKYCNGAIYNHRQVVSGNRAGARTVEAV